MTEPQLIQACIQEDAKAQQILYQQYLPYLYGICRRFNIPNAEIKDLIQEIYIEVFLSLRSYNSSKGQLKYWIKSIAIHKILKLLRKKKWVFDEWKEGSSEPIGWDLAIQQMDAEYILQLIWELPKGYATIFNLHVIDGYSHKEISSMLKIRESSSRSQLARARKLLQEKLLTLKHT
ncbi:MAG: sigma-70 family RNA polymerase sigma factor [Bacteroidota bacterium]